MDEILKMLEEEDAERGGTGNIDIAVLETIDETTARMDIKMRDAKIEGDMYYENVATWLESEKLRKRPAIPLNLYRGLRDRGYAMCVLQKTSKGRIFVLRLMINRFGNVEREFHSRVVTVVFFSEAGETGIDKPGIVVNYYFGDCDVSYEEQNAHDTLI